MASPVELVLRLSGLSSVTSGLRSVGSSLDQLSNQARSTGRALQQTGDSIRNVGFGLTAAITAPLAAATAGFVRMAAEATESENLFEVSMGNMAQAAREFSDDLASSLGLNAYELRRQIGIMQNFTTAMGISEEAAFGMSTGVAQLAGDMASFFNISSDEAFTKIQSGLAGEIEPLRRLGIVVNETAVADLAAAMGLTGELTDQQKVMIRYNLILEQTSNAQGDLARTINSPANAMRVLKSQAEQLAIEFGASLLPTIQAITLAIRDNIVPVIRGWVQAFAELDPRTRGFIVLAVGAVAAIGPLVTIVGVLISLFGTLLVVLGALFSPIGLIIAAVAALAAGIYFARDSVGSLLAAFEVLTGLSVNQIVSSVTRIGQTVFRFIGGAFEVAGQIFQDFVRTMGIGLATILDGAARAAEFMGQDGLAGTIQAAADAVRSLASGEFVDSTGRLAQAGEHLSDAWGSFTGNVEEARDTVVGATTTMADFLGGASNDLVSANEAAAASYDMLGESAIGAAGAIGGDGEGDTVASVFEEWAEGMQDLQALGVETAEGLTNAFDNFTKSFSSGVGNAFANAIVYGESFGKALEEVAKKSIAQLISALVQLGVQYVLNATLGQALAGAATAASAAFGKATAAAWASAAAMVSLATFGANGPPAMAALSATVGMAQGLAAFQRGTDSFTATGARLIMVGENGPERVSVTPLGAGAGMGGAGNVNVFIPDGAIFDEISFERVAERIGDAVMERLERGTV